MKAVAMEKPKFGDRVAWFNSRHATATPLLAFVANSNNDFHDTLDLNVMQPHRLRLVETVRHRSSKTLDNLTPADLADTGCWLTMSEWETVLSKREAEKAAQKAASAPATEPAKEPEKPEEAASKKQQKLAT